MQPVTVNLSPADLRKVGPALDPPIAVGVLSSTGRLPPQFGRSMFVGELSLDGSVRHVNGVVSMASFARAWRALTSPACWSLTPRGRPHPRADRNPGTEPRPAWLCTSPTCCRSAPTTATAATRPNPSRSTPRISPRSAGRNTSSGRVEVAAAGAHAVLMSGPLGSGKTLLARSLPSILPRMDIEEALEVTKVYSVAGLLRRGSR